MDSAKSAPHIKMTQIKPHLKNLKRTLNVSCNRLNYLRLDKNENLIPFPAQLIRKIRKKIDSNLISTYPNIYPLYEKISKWIGCKRENLYISAGSDAAIKSVFEAFINPNDKTLLLDPTYAMYYVYAKIFQARVLKIGYSPDLSINIDDLLECIRNEKPKLICIANPNSPTGTVIPQQGLMDIISIAYKNKGVVLVDEAYHLYYPHSLAGTIEKYKNLIVIRTFSKAFGLASARVGFAVTDKSLIYWLHKVRPMYETNAFAVLMAEIMLDNFQVIKRNIAATLEGKKLLEQELSKMNIKFYNSHTNFVNINVGSRVKSMAIVRHMRDRGILIGGGYPYKCLYNCIRVTVGSETMIKEFLKELQIFF